MSGNPTFVSTISIRTRPTTPSAPLSKWQLFQIRREILRRRSQAGAKSRAFLSRKRDIDNDNDFVLVVMSNNKPTFRGLPLELRLKIYDITFEEEHVNELEIYGCKNNQTTWCLPLNKLRPMGLMQVCRQIRAECLQRIFSANTFRRYIQRIEYPRKPTPEIALLPSKLHELLTVICKYYSIRFRNLQVRTVDATGYPVGHSVELQFLRGGYKPAFTLDQGWDVPEINQADADCKCEDIFKQVCDVPAWSVEPVTNACTYSDVTVMQTAFAGMYVQ